MRQLVFRLAALLALTCSLLSGMPGAVLAVAQPNDNGLASPAVTATYQGHAIDPVQASHYFCRYQRSALTDQSAGRRGGGADCPVCCPK